MAKYETTLKIKPGREEYLRANGLDAILELLFYKADLTMIQRARAFLEYVKERRKGKKPYLRSEWEDYLKKENLTQGQYYSFYNRLLGAGLIRIDRGQVYDSEEFATFFSTIMAIWNAWRAT